MESRNGFEDPISDEVTVIIHDVNNAVVGSVIALVGIAGNVINLVVFSKQGFSDTVNVSLFALSMSDLWSLNFLLVCNLFRNSLIYNSIPANPMEAHYLIAGWPHAFFTRLSGAFTAYITMERCLCVLIPLRIKTIITPRLRVIVLILTFVLLSLTIIPEYLANYTGWKFDPQKNITYLGLITFGDRETMASYNYMLAGVTQYASFVSVILFTSILVVKLNEKSKWRASTSSSGQGSGTNRQARENKTVMMIIMIAVTYCICFLPHLFNYTMTTILPEFSIGKKYNNSYSVVWSFTFLIDAVNSTLNPFVYYYMSSKYKVTFHILFSCKRERNKEITFQSS